MLDRDTILAKRNLRRETIEVPEWGGDVIVRELTGAERARYEAGFSDAVQGEQADPLKRIKRYEDMRAKVVVMATVTEDGSRVFKDEDVAAVNELSGKALDTIFTAVMRLSGYSKDEAEKLKKNSLNGEDSTSDSRLH